jgi:hypothetical protein
METSVPIEILLRSIISKQCRALFVMICLSMALCTCSNVDTNWHRYNGKRFEIIGPSRQAVKEVVSDGWRIIALAGDKSNELYNWGWELTIETSDRLMDDKLGDEWQPCISVDIQYILLDEDSFEVGKDTLRDQSHCMPYGMAETFRHTSTISKGKALRASKSLYKIFVGHASR